MNSSGENFSVPPIRVQINAGLIRKRLGTAFGRILAVGCGSGLEAVALAQALGAQVTGIDLDPSGFNPWAAERVNLQQGDATELVFPDEAFDLVYSCHALEHIPRFEKALGEMARVLRRGGGYFIETPNRKRLFGYLGSEKASWKEKILWNAADWKARWQGSFRNECGAHAGFLSSDLAKELEKAFGEAEEISLSYYLELYKKWSGLIAWLEHSGLGGVLFPSLFFIGKK